MDWYRIAPTMLAAAVVVVFLSVFSVHVGWEPLEHVKLLRRMLVTQSGHGDTEIIITGSLSVASGGPPGGGGPLKYFFLAPIYYLLSPSLVLASKIGNLVAALIDFVVVPALLVTFVSRTNGRLAAVLSGVSLFVFQRGVLAIAGSALPQSLYLFGQDHYYSGHWQYLFGLALALGAVLLLDTMIQRNRSQRGFVLPIIVGLIVGLTGGVQYVIGLSVALVVTVALLANRLVREWITIGVVAGLFIPLILAFGSNREQAVSGLRLLNDFDPGIDGAPDVLALLLLLAVSITLVRAAYRLSESRVFESLLLVSSVLVYIYTGYMDWVMGYLLYTVLIPGLLCITLLGLQSKPGMVRDWITTVEAYDLTHREAVLFGVVVGGGITLPLFLAVPG